MRQHIEDACEQIDAALFTGDSFSDGNSRNELRDYIERWQAQLEVWQKMNDEEEKDRKIAALNKEFIALMIDKGERTT